MKTTIYLFLLAPALVLLSHCGKPGCTDPAAYNYDAFNPATRDDGSCDYLGAATFWILYDTNSQTNPNTSLEIYQITDNDSTLVAEGSISPSYKPVVNCGVDPLLKAEYIQLVPGQYSYVGTQYVFPKIIFQGTFQVTPNGCILIEVD